MKIEPPMTLKKIIITKLMTVNTYANLQQYKIL